MPFDGYKTSSLRQTPVASAARTTSGNSGALTGFGNVRTIRAQLNTTAVSGTTPSMTAIIEDSVDGGANWNTVGTFTAVTAVGRQVVNVPAPFGDQVRVSWTITGTTPSFTSQVDWVLDAAAGI